MRMWTNEHTALSPKEQPTCNASRTQNQLVRIRFSRFTTICMCLFTAQGNSVSHSHTDEVLTDEPVNVLHVDYFSLYVESRYFPLTEHLVEILMVCHSQHFWCTLFVLLPSQIFVISQAEPRLPLQLEDAVRPDGEGEEVRMNAWMDELAWKVYFTQHPQWYRHFSALFSLSTC